MSKKRVSREELETLIIPITEETLLEAPHETKLLETRHGSLTTKLNMIKMLAASLGNVSASCDLCGIDPDTHYRWLRLDAEYNRRVLEEKNRLLDVAEAQLMLNIKAGKEQSLIFFLKKQGKGRGYGDDPIVNLDANLEAIRKLSDSDIDNMLLSYQNRNQAVLGTGDAMSDLDLDL